MNKWLSSSAMIAALLLSQSAIAASKPTVLLVHGAFAEPASCDGVAKLVKDGYPVVAVTNPLRDLKYDADYVSAILKSVDGPVVLVGPSYGGSVITDVRVEGTNVKSLVFMAGFAPDTGESASGIGKKFPTGTLGETCAKIMDFFDRPTISERRYLFTR